MRVAVLSVLVLAGCASSPTPFHYAVVNADSVVARDAAVDAQRLMEIRQAAGRDFVWFDHRNAEYVVTDPVQVGLANRAIDPVRRVYRVMQRSTFAGTSVIAWATTNHEVTLEHRLSRAAKEIDLQMTSLLEVWLSHGVARKLRRPLRAVAIAACCISFGTRCRRFQASSSRSVAGTFTSGMFPARSEPFLAVH